MRVLVTEAREAGNPCGVDCRVEVFASRRPIPPLLDRTSRSVGSWRRAFVRRAAEICSAGASSSFEIRTLKRGLGRCTNVPGTSSGAAVSGWRTGSWDEPGTISAPSPSTILSERHLLGRRQDHRRSDRPTADDRAGVRDFHPDAFEAVSAPT